MAKLYYIPNGPMNLQLIFPGVDWANVSEYNIEVYTEQTVQLVAIGPQMVMEGCADDIRIHFLNNMGTIDAINFHKVSIEHEPKTSNYEKFPSSVRRDHQIGRLGGSSNDTYVCSIVVSEDQIPYFDELFDSPLAWIEWPGGEGQVPDYLPIVITDKKSPKLKEDDRFSYELGIEFRLSKPKLILRS